MEFEEINEKFEGKLLETRRKNTGNFLLGYTIVYVDLLNNFLCLHIVVSPILSSNKYKICDCNV